MRDVGAPKVLSSSASSSSSSPPLELNYCSPFFAEFFRIIISRFDILLGSQLLRLQATHCIEWPVAGWLGVCLFVCFGDSTSDSFRIIFIILHFLIIGSIYVGMCGHLEFFHVDLVAIPSSFRLLSRFVFEVVHLVPVALMFVRLFGVARKVILVRRKMQNLTVITLYLLN